MKNEMIEYVVNPKPCWCVVHKRPATHIRRVPKMDDEHHCDPKLGGITMCCKCQCKERGIDE